MQENTWGKVTLDGLIFGLGGGGVIFGMLIGLHICGAYIP